jgi:hypothetical protein
MDSALVKWLLKRNRENNPDLNQKDMVILHQFNRGVFAPSNFVILKCNLKFIQYIINRCLSICFKIRNMASYGWNRI